MCTPPHLAEQCSNTSDVPLTWEENIIQKSITQHWTQINSQINRNIWEHPEVAGHETFAHDTICKFFDSLGPEYIVTRHAYSTLDNHFTTSLTVDAGTGGRLVIFNAEYDALPRMGTDGQPAHACGHNLIASASVAAFLATAEALQASGRSGRLRFLGTPSEESGGGKLELIKQGAYDEVDACLMVHPGPEFKSNPQVEAVAVTRSLASQRLHVVFEGKAAHAGIAPWDGKNALDAMVTAYVGISNLRQRFKPTERVNGVIKDGGKAANIIPDSVSAEFSIRANNKENLELLRGRVNGCLKAGAAAAELAPEDCKVTSGKPYLDLRANRGLCRLFTEKMKRFGHNVVEELPEITDNPGAATDQGNVSYICPAMQPGFSIGCEAMNHTRGFTEEAIKGEAFQRAMNCAQGMAACAYAILTDDKSAKDVRSEFEHTRNEAVIYERVRRASCGGPKAERFSILSKIYAPATKRSATEEELNLVHAVWAKMLALDEF